MADTAANEVLAAVFARVCEGSEEAFAELYDITSARLHGLILSVVRAPDLAAEITQEVYVEVWRQAARWSADKGSVRAWMHTIAHRRAVDRVRSVQRETEREVRWAGTTRESEPDHTWEGVEQRLEVEGVRAALEELSTLQKEAVSLAYYGGYSHREVAEILGLPLGTVKTRIRDGLLGLRSVMGAGT
ncbi:sigma-70 family RNA polymerase sigma factor [Tessaracoccus antarcticus]|uniref:sigma-70 family RNA polymerase sigma factor n=1 Tax=Tessaracoccus antarcticus TaxID=2479848 RepID=UPI001F265223|nr:sigma-70 family RNA polymerase sigma factor [Tessaracoccus antarcticus]